MAKWAARPQILFSDSVPATRVARSAIQIIPDIITREAKAAGQAITEQILTDGCGLMSTALAERIYNNQNLQLTHGRPSAAQIRIGGSKGVLTIMSPSESLLYQGKDIVLRESMVKAYSDEKYEGDPSLLTLDVLRCDSLKIGTTISSEAIIAMAHGGVPSSVFEKMVQDGLKELRDELYPKPLQQEETKEEVLIRLVSNIYRRGGIGMERDKRKAREEGKSSKVIGLVSKGSNEWELGDDGNLLSIDVSERFEVDPVTGQPGSIAECLYEAVSNGVDPSTSYFAGQKLNNLINVISMRMVREFKIPVEQSLSAFIVPDTLGVLGPEEIFISFGNRAPEDPTAKQPMKYLLGECLAFRSPCKLPTDVRKFKAVYKEELTHMVDVIVMSANSEKCKRSPASFLGGGDYDGDTAQLFWGKDLVDHFNNSDEGFANIPEDFVIDNFDKQVVKGTEFLEIMNGKDEETRIVNMQYWLLGGMLSNDATSDYSNMHGNAVYAHGYAHEETTRLARMFCHVLDARKSGLKVKREVKVNDVRTYGGDLEWRSWKKDTVAGDGGVRVVKRGKGLGVFIMDILKDVGEKKQRELIGEFKSIIANPTTDDYEHLITPWRNINGCKTRALCESNGCKDRTLCDELRMILQHVSICYELYQLIVWDRYDTTISIENSYLEKLKGGEGEKVKPTPRKSTIPRMYMSKEIVKAENLEFGLKRLVLLRQLAIVWKEYPKDHDIRLTIRFGQKVLARRLKIGAAADIMDNNPYAKTHIQFPFDLDFIMTCAIKAEMYNPNQDPATCLPAVHAMMKPR